jgi:hypothetical protein
LDLPFVHQWQARRKIVAPKLIGVNSGATQKAHAGSFSDTFANGGIEREDLRIA